MHDEPATPYGYQGDARPEQTEVVIRRAHIGRASNDIGSARQPDGSYEAIISEYDLHRHGPAWLTRLSQSYGHAAAQRYAVDHGYDVATDEIQQDGTRRLTLRRTN
ncbi:DUF1257 domain-containing protein [Streptomyces phytophilus]|uniref:DUF1257 domain-containing protein n=1 Tax=Streptomyces phytophilus TaxID=722715 RepID=UPI001C68B393|nr:DUF1257 domain-containing protein [Streptomyces phytophilus]